MDISKIENLDTLCVQAGFQPKSGDPRIAPIVQSTTFYYEQAEQLADLFDLKSDGFFYSRLGNPTCDVLERKVSALEGGIGALATSSGQAASTILATNLCAAGDHIICAQTVYGGTFNLFDVTLRKLGIETTFVPPDATEEQIEREVRPNTRLIFGETIANPAITVLAFEQYAAVAKRHGIVFAVDNTLATPIHCRPLKLGANIVLHSATKYLDGHATSVGGLLVDGGNFTFEGNPRYPEFNRPDESYHGLVYARDCGRAAFIVKARVQMMRDLGAMMAPMNAFLINLGTETLAVRMERTSKNALEIARRLQQSDKVEFVKYPMLEDFAYRENAAKYLTGGGGGMLSFGLKGGRAACEKLIGNLNFVALVTHVADLRSSVIHPASTTHRQLSEEALKGAGVPANLIRFSAGIENVEDIWADLEQALARS